MVCERARFRRAQQRVDGRQRAQNVLEELVESIRSAGNQTPEMEVADRSGGRTMSKSDEKLPKGTGAGSKGEIESSNNSDEQK